LSLLFLNTGRLRLWVRMFLFLSLTLSGTAALSYLVPAEMPYGALPALVGSLLAGWWLLWLDRRPPGALGFYLDSGVGKELLLSTGLGMLVAGGVVAGLVLSGTVRWAVVGGTWLAYAKEAGASLWFFSIPAAAEEALMRGYLLQALAEIWGGGWALAGTSVVFGALHLANPNTTWLGLGNIVMAGVFLGVIYLKTASLWWATGAHLGWNWFHGFVADLPVSGLELVDAPILEPRIGGPEWLSGGSFGPEGSVVAMVVLAVSAAVLWNTSWLRPGRKAREVRPLFLAPQG
jgi:membrane protease YdiL (CAAX protease family)